ncbi:F0F1 ATP synthase subunit gamma [Marinobacter caseinilyticus]|uniref:F0F1 ATP synthase subunit gamma n=1 Tax=Marinobacter caseinilyticus TaxID=2692195 RepID=UPI001408C915|nr:FoF1 ATP synthase subunit gamma [Marinobacter caseinilyticus]
MTQTFEALSRQDETLTSIRGIVHTMKTLSAINAVPYEHAARAIEAYHETILQGLQAMLSLTGPFSGPVVQPSGVVCVVFGSDHGLCGNYNETLASAVMTMPGATTQAAPDFRVLCVGAQLRSALIGRGLRPEYVFLPPASADGIGRLATDIVTRLDAIGQSDATHRMAVTMVFTERSEHGSQTPVVRPLLPLAPELMAELAERPWDSRSLPAYSMTLDTLFAALLQNHIFASVFRASAEAMVTENAARLVLMQQAEQSVDDRLEEVEGQMKAVRQDEITAELLDIIVGFEALGKTQRHG